MDKEKKVEEQEQPVEKPQVQEQKVKTLLDVNVNEHTKKKGRLTYLSWAWAMAEMLKVYPDMNYEVIKNKDGGVLHGDSQMGYFVETSVTAGGITRTMWLPVMDYKNQPILKPNVMEINKSLMRCLTKTLATWGLGLYIYAGEDLPDKVTDANPAPKKTANTDKLAALKKQIAKTCSDLGGTKNKDVMAVVGKLGNPNSLRSEKACNEYLQALAKIKPVK